MYERTVLIELAAVLWADVGGMLVLRVGRLVCVWVEGEDELFLGSWKDFLVDQGNRIAELVTDRVTVISCVVVCVTSVGYS